MPKSLTWNPAATVPSKPYAPEYLLSDGKMSALATFEPPVGWVLLDLEDEEFDVKTMVGWLVVTFPKVKKVKAVKAVKKVAPSKSSAELQSAAVAMASSRSTVISIRK